MEAVLKFKFATIEKREGERHEDFASWRSASRKESERDIHD